MIPAAFEYRRAGSVAEALGLLAEHGDEAKLLAGGHSLLPLMKLRMATPSLLVDVSRLRELSYVRDEGDHVAVGALTRHADVASDPMVVRDVPVLAHVAGQIGDPQVRHRGTIGGSIAHGDPASDLPAVALALGASFVIEGPAGTREEAADGFFVGFLETVLGPDEILTEIRLPKAPGSAWGFEKLTKRAQDWAIVGAVAARRGDGGVGVGLVNMAPVPMRAAAVEAAVAGGAGPRQAAEVAADGTEPSSDINATADYRRHLARVLVRRALERTLA